MFMSFKEIGMIIIITLFMVTPTFSSNVYYMIGHIDQKQADNFHQFIAGKKTLNPQTNRILLVLNGNGGEAKAMEAIRQMIVSSSIPIDTFAKDNVISADAYLFLFGQNRYDVNASLYYHQVYSNKITQKDKKETAWVNQFLKSEIKKHTGLKDSVINYIFKHTGSLTRIDPLIALKFGISTSNNIPDMSVYKTKN